MTTIETPELRAEFAACKHLTTQQIAARLEDHADIETLTAELLSMCVERTDTTLFKSLPFVIRHTMYGEADIADWIITYQATVEHTISEADDSAAFDAHIRWERWEDLVRLVNDDLQAMALFVARRTVALGDAGVAALGHRWFMSVNFPGTADTDHPGRLNAILTLRVEDDAALEAFVAEVGLDALLLARAKVLSGTMSDLGVARDLAGTYLRWEVAGHDMMSHVDFSEDGKAAARLITRAEAEGIDPSTGVTTFFTTPKAFLYAAGGKEGLGQQLVAGTMKLLGEPHRLAAFSAATQKMAQPADPQ